MKTGSVGRNALPRNFYDQPTLEVARSLIGARLCVKPGEQTISGIITETEAYIGEKDLGCHAKSGLTKRTAVMYGQPGMAYIYFTYGNHWMFCVVTEAAGIPAAVLVRTVVIDQGLELVSRNRGHVSRKHWSDGPGKLTQAMEIDGSQHGADITDPTSGIWIEEGRLIPEESVTIRPRVGLYNVPEPWKSIPWRYLVTRKTNLEDLWDY